MVARTCGVLKAFPWLKEERRERCQGFGFCNCAQSSLATLADSGARPRWLRWHGGAVRARAAPKCFFAPTDSDLSAVLVSTYSTFTYLCSGTSAALGADDLPSSSQVCLAVYDLICLFTVLVRRLQLKHQPTTAYFRRAADFHPLPGMVPCQRLHCYLRDPLYQARDSPCLPSAHSFLISSSLFLRCNIDFYSRICFGHRHASTATQTLLRSAQRILP